MAESIPQAILQKLSELDPNSSFTGSLPRISSSSGAVYYAKLGSPSENEQYTGEAQSLIALDNAAPGLVPRHLCNGVLEDEKPFFISEYAEIATLSYRAADILAKRMALELHSEEHASLNGFGFSIPTYCGATKLSNGWFDTWEKCYASMTGDLLSQLESQGRYRTLCTKGEVVKNEVIPKLLGMLTLWASSVIVTLTCVQSGPLDIQPVILHGDLWSGNAGLNKRTGQPIIFDPASYFGHNEADLSIARIFGGFPSSFFETYHQHRPKSEPVDQYELRTNLYELFHYLNHTLIFGGHYAASAERKLDTLIAALPNL